jgi:hypothetical protein
MKLLGLCICYDVKNYGSMLQAYATVHFLKERHIQYEIIRYKKKISIGFILKSLFCLVNPVFITGMYNRIKKYYQLIKHPQFAQNLKTRNVRFDNFSKKRFSCFSPVYKGYKSLCIQAKKYSACMVGSDQLWLPVGLATNFYDLMFTDENTIQISYATSFGVSSIPFFQRYQTSVFLKRIHYLSVRENQGQEIIKAIAQRDAKIVVDPALLFNEQQWQDIIPNIIEYHEPYIFTYFLGANEEHRNAVRILSKELGLKIVVLRHIDEYIKEDEKFGDYAPYNIGPDEFVNLIRGAMYICTDSFHGTVFSIIHHKQFIVFDRYLKKSKNSKNSRIDTLCTNLGLMDRRFDNNLEMLVLKMAKTINYTLVDEKLHELRALSRQFLDEALDCVSSDGKKII